MFSGVSLVPFLPSGGGGEGTLSKASGLPPQLTPLHFPLVCSLHCHFPHLSQRNLNHCLSQDILSCLSWQCAEQVLQMLCVHSGMYTWRLSTFCFQEAYWLQECFRKWR